MSQWLGTGMITSPFGLSEVEAHWSPSTPLRANGVSTNWGIPVLA